MTKIEVYSDWCSYDRLDGIDLQDGEMLEIEWPDGVRETCMVKIKTTSYRHIEHGSFFDEPIRESYFELDIHGMKVPLFLRNTNILARREAL